jgi:ribosomal protein L40E
LTPLVVGTLLAIAALSFVLYPLIVGDGTLNSARGILTNDVRDPSQNTAIDALREIEFDRATGKLSESDYNELKTSYTRRALAVMRSSGAAICDRCGPRPEADAEFCSNCGNPVSR